MNNLLKEIEWRRHLPGLILFAAAFILFIVSGIHYLDEKKKLLASINSYKQQQYSNSAANDSLQILNENLTPYQQLQDQGVIGTGRRLQWMEVTQKLSDSYRIPLVDFTLDSAQEVDELENVYWNPELSMSVTPMTLELDLRHEGDFYRYMEGLEIESEGLYSIEHCELTRKLVSREEDPALAGIESRCSLLWYSLDDITGSWEETAGL